MNTIEFVTPRLRCRRWVPADIDTVHAVYSDPEAMRFVGEGRPITRAECVDWMAVTARNYETRGYGMFALEEIDGGAVVGFCGIVHPGGQPEPELKYAFLQRVWGRGYATEAVVHLLRHARSAFGLQRIIATVAEGNVRSQQVMQKAGARLDRQRANEDGSMTRVYVCPGSDAAVPPPA